MQASLRELFRSYTRSFRPGKAGGLFCSEDKYFEKFRRSTRHRDVVNFFKRRAMVRMIEARYYGTVDIFP
jgi:hypothetical protein